MVKTRTLPRDMHMLFAVGRVEASWWAGAELGVATLKREGAGGRAARSGMLFVVGGIAVAGDVGSAAQTRHHY